MCRQCRSWGGARGPIGRISDVGEEAVTRAVAGRQAVGYTPATTSTARLEARLSAAAIEQSLSEYVATLIRRDAQRTGIDQLVATDREEVTR
ncbi:MAG: hypothetical protein ACI9MR_002399 [Myxococcota bacterium]